MAETVIHTSQGLSDSSNKTFCQAKFQSEIDTSVSREMVDSSRLSFAPQRNGKPPPLAMDEYVVSGLDDVPHWR